ncbi:hypothetical protein N7462_009664 [Penicillium macrosclerotiorum]|uniref:uncharacterized protein n=1 Tax=Penicillium macrosclerotiorum TaxID=303699 RepID=UPI002549698A|nr:uncharacterized protein N7462_009664 [Penicillium macrosclerotiorum]KAJ5674225.1 hypothetical protein N7462_009664 [Penicillium macrosclerotiorum]
MAGFETDFMASSSSNQHRARWALRIPLAQLVALEYGFLCTRESRRRDLISANLTLVLTFLRRGTWRPPQGSRVVASALAPASTRPGGSSRIQKNYRSEPISMQDHSWPFIHQDKKGTEVEWREHDRASTWPKSSRGKENWEVSQRGNNHDPQAPKMPDVLPSPDGVERTFHGPRLAHSKQSRPSAAGSD